MTQFSANTPSTAMGDLRASFAAIVNHSRPLIETDLLSLRGRVTAAVDELKAAGVLPEHVIVTVRQLAVDAGFQQRTSPLFERLSMWCIQRYYEPRAK